MNLLPDHDGHDGTSFDGPYEAVNVAGAPAYAGEQAARVTRSGLDVPVSWAGADRTPGEGTIRVRVRLEGRERNAIRLYAVYLRP